MLNRTLGHFMWPCIMARHAVFTALISGTTPAVCTIAGRANSYVCAIVIKFVLTNAACPLIHAIEYVFVVLQQHLYTVDFPSRHISDLVTHLSQLPGIGQKTALRLALHLVKERATLAPLLGHNLLALETEVCTCRQCHNLSDGDLCNICTSIRRNAEQICVVEGVQDLLALERTGQYNGMYHLLGGLIHPMQGIGPSDLNIDSLLRRVTDAAPRELILALSSTMEGETTAFYLVKKLKHIPIHITNIARGIPLGSNLEYADEMTLGRSLLQRVEYSLPAT
jgi:recombination protein RecR